jgi:flagellar biosynthesis protein FlhF
VQTKIYFASSVSAALEVARRELGANALLVGSQPAPAESRQFGRLEVTFAWDPADRQAEGAAEAARPDSEIDEIRREISALRATVAGSENAAREDGIIAARLTGAGVDSVIAREIAAAATEKPGDPHEAALRELTRRISTAPFAEIKPGESRAMAFIGPPGRGKTTSLIKVAVRCGLARRIPVRIYSAGAHSAGGQQQMARYAAILGAPWHAYESLDALHLALGGEAWKGLALIDTPGLAPAEQSEMDEFRDFFAARPEIEKHLVLRAEARSADLFQVLLRFSGLKPSRLLFTGVDEAVDPVSMADMLMRCGIPATFAGTGQRIPEDLEELNAAKIARALWAASSNADSNPNIRFAAVAA